MFMSDSAISAYYKRLEKQLNEHNKDSDITYDLSYYYTRKPNSRIRTNLQSDNDGTVYVETVKTIMEMIYLLTVRQVKGVALFGLVQSAKTASQILSVLLSCVIAYLKKDQYTHPIFFIPNQKGNYLSQFKAKYNQLLSCFEEVIICYKNDKISLRQYISDICFERNEAYKEISPEAYKMFSKSQWNTFHSIKDNLLDENPLILPMSKKLIDFIQILFVAIADRGQKIILDRDEAHAAAAYGSIGDLIMSGKKMNILRKIKEQRELEDDIYHSINDKGGYCQFVVTSATNFGALHFEHKVPLVINKNYTGIDFAYQDENGNAIKIGEQSGIEITTPDLIKQSEMGERLGIHYFKYIKPSWYKDEEAYLKNIDKHRLQRYFAGWVDYKKKCAVAIAKMVNYMLSSGIKSGNKFLLRFVNDNTKMDNFIADMLPYLDKDILVIKEYKDKHESIKELLKNHNAGPDQKVLLVPSAGCRMSDSLSKDFSYGADMTYQSTTLSALLQGVLGRLSGYFKDPIIMLSDENCQTIKDYIENGHLPTPSMKLTGDVGTMREKSYETFRKENYINNPIIVEIFQRLQALIDNQEININRKTGKPKISLGKKIESCFIKDYITEIGLSHIKERHARYPLLNETNVDGNGRSYLLNDSGYVVMGIRAEGEGRHSHLGGREKGKVTGIIRIEFVKIGRYGTLRAKVVGFDIAVFQGSVLVKNESSLNKVK